MNDTTLYLKYRPLKLEELDSERVRDSLKRIVASGRIPHAFLFAGPKGTGKTSAARIIAKILNCENPLAGPEPCGKCGQCTSISADSNLDVIEMDAASHRGIDDVRALRDAVKLAPAKAKNKIYIIDEVHMLTTEAANALLKTLEEPPPHVYFVLATTNPEKLLETIRSRATFVSFKKASPDEVIRSLGRVVKGEKIKIEIQAQELIAKAASGSFRDAVKILEQLVVEKRNLSIESVKELLFQKKAFDVEKFLEHIANKETSTALEEVDSAVNSGVTVSNILTATLERLREGMLAQVGIERPPLGGFTKQELTALIKLFGKAEKDVAGASIEELPLEVAIVEWCEPKLITQNSKFKITHVVEKAELEIPRAISLVPKEKDEKQSLEVPVKSSDPAGNLKEVNEEVWRKILATVKPINTSIEALLRAAKPMSFDGKTLILGVFYKFHKERLEDFHHRRILEEVVTGVLGNPTKILCTLTAPPQRTENKKQENEVVLTEGGDEDIIKVAEEIFGN